MNWYLDALNKDPVVTVTNQATYNYTTTYSAQKPFLLILQPTNQPNLKTLSYI